MAQCRRHLHLLLGLQLAVVIFIIYHNTRNTDGTRDEAKLRWPHRRLTKGEPSGSAEGEATTTTRQPAAAAGARLGAGDDEAERSVLTRLELYRDRKTMIRQTCHKYGLGNLTAASDKGDTGSLYRTMETQFPWPPEKSLMLEPSWHLLYCWIHKVASSSWSEVFFYLKGKEVPSTRLHEATQYFSLRSHGVELGPALRSSLVFTIVRHPFERLVSAYRDKFELAKKYAYIYSHYAAKVLSLTAASPGERRVRRPTFSEFVSYLLKTPVSEYNDHWVPYWLHCHMCHVEYDVIGKMETIKEDIDFITERSGLAAHNVTLPWANKKSDGENVSVEYFKQLSESQVKELYEIYRPDFEMFGYGVEQYFGLKSKSDP